MVDVNNKPLTLDQMEIKALWELKQVYGKKPVNDLWDEIYPELRQLEKKGVSHAAIVGYLKFLVRRELTKE